jgi:hypothetical protein
MSVVASRFTPNQGGPSEAGRAHERVDRSSTHPHEDFPRPHVLLPNPILLVWRIEGNRIGNHPLIIVNALTIWLPLSVIFRLPDGMRHSAANNAAGLWPVEGNSA